MSWATAHRRGAQQRAPRATAPAMVGRRPWPVRAVFHWRYGYKTERYGRYGWGSVAGCLCAIKAAWVRKGTSEHGTWPAQSPQPGAGRVQWRSPVPTLPPVVKAPKAVRSHLGMSAPAQSHSVNVCHPAARAALLLLTMRPGAVEVGREALPELRAVHCPPFWSVPWCWSRNPHDRLCQDEGWWKVGLSNGMAIPICPSLVPQISSATACRRRVGTAAFQRDEVAGAPVRVTDLAHELPPCLWAAGDVAVTVACA